MGSLHLEVRVVEGLLGTESLPVVELEALLDELLALIGDVSVLGGVFRELDFGSLQDLAPIEVLRLGQAVSERSHAVEHLVEDHAGCPHVHLGGDLDARGIFSLFQSLRRLVPECPHPITRVLDLCGVGAHLFAQAEVQQLQHAISKHHVAWLEVVVDDGLVAGGQVSQRGENLPDDGPCLPLLQALVATKVN